MHIPKNRLFKWIGGKNWLKKELLEKTETILRDKKEVEFYIEPFVGGLGSFLAIYPKLKDKKIKKIVLNDINTLIIETYIQVKNNPEKLLAEILKIEKEHYKTIPDSAYKLHMTEDKEKLKIQLSKTKDFYNKKRDEFNYKKFDRNISIETVAIFLYLMSNCFNGVYRENSKGFYNTPFNWSNTKQNIEGRTKKIKEYSSFFNETEFIFENMDVFDLLDKYNEKNSFIYLDPPYLNEKSIENKYSKEDFGEFEQAKLLDYILKYDMVLFSNHYMDYFVQFFERKNIKYSKIARKNIMSASKESRESDIYEILAYKY